MPYRQCNTRPIQLPWEFIGRRVSVKLLAWFSDGSRSFAHSLPREWADDLEPSENQAMKHLVEQELDRHFGASTIYLLYKWSIQLEWWCHSYCGRTEVKVIFAELVVSLYPQLLIFALHRYDLCHTGIKWTRSGHASNKASKHSWPARTSHQYPGGHWWVQIPLKPQIFFWALVATALVAS